MNKTALITGASSGIGLEFAREFAKNKTDVVLVARNESRLKEIAGEIVERYGIRVFVMAIDLGKPDAAAEVFERVKKENLFIEYLVNNAGFGDLGMFSDTSWKKEEEMITLNMNPASMAIPPRVGTTCLAAERVFGTSNNFLALAAFMIPGITK